MNIHTKLTLVCLLTISFLSSGQAQGIQYPYSKRELLMALIKINDEQIPNALKRQLTDNG
jgi:hypothetical protein